MDSGALRHQATDSSCLMMPSSNGNVFRVTDPLCREFTGHRWIPRTKVSDAELWWFLWYAPHKRSSKQSWGWWFETPSGSLWRHCNVYHAWYTCSCLPCIYLPDQHEHFLMYFNQYRFVSNNKNMLEKYAFHEKNISQEPWGKCFHFMTSSWTDVVPRMDYSWKTKAMLWLPLPYPYHAKNTGSCFLWERAPTGCAIAQYQWWPPKREHIIWLYSIYWYNR